ncbi:sugar ABC transporter ATP-binding protein [Telmatospirillum siberiense]|uniref:Sugar ABC transporter ATP-binding protein n=1 Tax=Telmatospirillum siberiense TaxID=382514 RepID=A0A2N3PR39_9PROT|nr:sugar ABC transporter ATP-binding protein [Telmatospirillum siberiense]PKU22861.1 sugar ABC transporter ATP-binding protein [Telmatospirillum siberiense]
MNAVPLPPGTPPRVEARGISKRYPGLLALDHVTFSVMPGEVHVLFGENGAGKSTLVSIIAGVNEPSDGEVVVNGESAEIHSVHDARTYGINAVFQEFSLVPSLSVLDNLFLGDEIRRGPFLDHARMRREATALFGRIGFPLDLDTPVSSLGRAEQQMLEIAKALRREPTTLILDEPTASLTEKETDRLFSFIAELKTRGIGIIYISHRIQEFQRIADRITVLRDGRVRGVVPADTPESELVELMAGRAIGKIYPSIAHRPGPPILSARDLTGAGVEGVSFDVRPGEVLGLAGLVGCGKSEVWRIILGLSRRSSGSVTLAGRDMSAANTGDMIRAGVFYLPPDRKSEGLMLALSSLDNMALGMLAGDQVSRSRGRISNRAIRTEGLRLAAQVDLAPGHLPRPVSQLSGGNQQKILFSRGFARTWEVFVFDEPTVGVDVGTRAALYLLIKQLTESGKAVVVISSDLPEVMNLSHRLLVFARGRISTVLERDEIEESAILGHFFKQGELAR